MINVAVAILAHPTTCVCGARGARLIIDGAPPCCPACADVAIRKIVRGRA